MDPNKTCNCAIFIFAETRFSSQDADGMYDISG